MLLWVSSHLAGSDPPFLCLRSSHPKGELKAKQQKHSVRWVRAAVPGKPGERWLRYLPSTRTCLGTGDLILPCLRGMVTRAPAGAGSQSTQGSPWVPPSRAVCCRARGGGGWCCSQLWLVQGYCRPHLLPRPDTDLAAVREAFPLSRSSRGALGRGSAA